MSAMLSHETVEMTKFVWSNRSEMREETKEEEWQTRFLHLLYFVSIGYMSIVSLNFSVQFNRISAKKTVTFSIFINHIRKLKIKNKQCNDRSANQ